MNEMNNKQVTSEELETVNGGIGLSVCKVPPRHWEKKRGKSFLPTYEPVDVQMYLWMNLRMGERPAAGNHKSGTCDGTIRTYRSVFLFSEYAATDVIWNEHRS